MPTRVSIQVFGTKLSWPPTSKQFVHFLNWTYRLYPVKLRTCRLLKMVYLFVASIVVYFRIAVLEGRQNDQTRTERILEVRFNLTACIVVIIRYPSYFRFCLTCVFGRLKNSFGFLSWKSSLPTVGPVLNILISVMKGKIIVVPASISTANNHHHANDANKPFVTNGK